ncbi:hypothetical protein EDB87DRAFT_1581906 [Lactarius vividus]|nr:hypothetical protein EDB87DRAFT_1581906 [Lactarius vividus]
MDQYEIRHMLALMIQFELTTILSRSDVVHTTGSNTTNVLKLAQVDQANVGGVGAAATESLDAAGLDRVLSTEIKALLDKRCSPPSLIRPSHGIFGIPIMNPHVVECGEIGSEEKFNPAVRRRHVYGPGANGVNCDAAPLAAQWRLPLVYLLLVGVGWDRRPQTSEDIGCASLMADEPGSIREIDSSITRLQHLLATSSRSDPPRIHSIATLAFERGRRYKLSNQSEDLDKSIIHLTESILLQPSSWLKLELSPTIPVTFFALALALVRRSEASSQPEDAIYAAKYLRHLRDQPYTVPRFLRQAVAACLVDALACQVEFGANNLMQCIEEMAVLCHELLTSNPSDDNTTRSISRFAAVVSSEITLWAPDQPLNQVIECLRLARQQRPDLRIARKALSFSLGYRYCMTLVNDDYEEDVSGIDELVTSGSAGDSQNADVAPIQIIATALATLRSMAYQSPEYSEEAIYRAPFSLKRHSDNPMLEKLELLRELLSGIGNIDITEIEEAIERGRTILPSAPTDLFTSALFVEFGEILFEAFQRTNKIEYLNEPISAHRQVYGLPSFPSYFTQDHDEMMKLLSHCASNAHVILPARFQYSCLWAYSARCSLHPSVSKALTCIGSRKRLRFLNEGEPCFGPKCVTFEHPQLGHEFVAINKDLEELTKSIQPSLELNIDDAADNSRAVDPFGRLLLKQRGLLKERDSLTSRIRALPGFDSFLTSPSFNTLRSAASSGPVIIINHSKFRSDILHNTSPFLIPTARDFYDRAGALKGRLLDSRNRHGLYSSHYDETLASVLAELYDLVGKPVIDRLRQLQVPEQSRIWWCPTSVFCSLPLHAMGPIPSDCRKKRYFLDLYYTPTLSALIQSRNRDSVSVSPDRPSLLLVAQPDPSLPTVRGEIQVVQALDTEVTSLISEAATPAAVIDGFRHHRFVHIACHGTLETGKPFEAGFELCGERLTLLEVVRLHLSPPPNSHFSLLVTRPRFRSVVGTTWAIVDEDGQDLTKHFYKALFSDSGRDKGVPCRERSAKALQFAVKKLRRKRWNHPGEMGELRSLWRINAGYPSRGTAYPQSGIVHKSNLLANTKEMDKSTLKLGGGRVKETVPRDCGIRAPVQEMSDWSGAEAYMMVKQREHRDGWGTKVEGPSAGASQVRQVMR